MEPTVSAGMYCTLQAFKVLYKFLVNADILHIKGSDRFLRHTWREINIDSLLESITGGCCFYLNNAPPLPAN
jgi:hypothetical protein